jgi:hypothetical protein
MPIYGKWRSRAREENRMIIDSVKPHRKQPFG